MNPVTLAVIAVIAAFLALPFLSWPLSLLFRLYEAYIDWVLDRMRPD